MSSVRVVVLYRMRRSTEILNGPNSKRFGAITTSVKKMGLHNLEGHLALCTGIVSDIQYSIMIFVK